MPKRSRRPATASLHCTTRCIGWMFCGTLIRAAAPTTAHRAWTARRSRTSRSTACGSRWVNWRRNSRSTRIDGKPSGGCISQRRMASKGRWGYRWFVHTALLSRSLRDRVLADCPALPSFLGRLPSRHLPTSLPVDAHFDDRFCQRRRTGFRKRSMISGVSRTHQGPCGLAWMPSNRPDLHQAAMVDTSTFRAFAAAWAEQRPSPRAPCAHAAGAAGQPLRMPWT